MLKQIISVVSWAAVLHFSIILAHSEHDDSLIAPVTPSFTPAPGSVAPWNATFTDSLKRSLLAGYDKFARPSHHQVATNVTIGLTMYHFEFDDKSSQLIVYGWLKMQWYDDKLQWNASEYGGLNALHVAEHEIWQPDIVLYNSASGNVVDHYGNTHSIIWSNGVVLWVPPTKLNVFCEVNLKKWPRDTQSCYFAFGSWTYDGIQLKLYADETPEGKGVGVLTEQLTENTEWILMNSCQETEEKYYDCCPDAPYGKVTYTVIIQRRGDILALVLHSQAAVAIILTLLAHCLPTTPDVSAPRLLLAALPPTILVLGLFYLGYRLPPTQYIPDIVSLYTGSLYLTLVSAAMTILVLNIARGRRAMPWLLKKFLGCKIARFVGAPPLHNAHDSTCEELKVTSPGSTGEAEGISTTSPPPSKCWIALATFIDRLSLLLLTIAFIIIFIIYSC